VEGVCEYIEQAVADSRQRVVLQLGDWTCYEMLRSASEFDGGTSGGLLRTR